MDALARKGQWQKKWKKCEKQKKWRKPNVDKCKIIRDNNAANGCVD